GERHLSARDLLARPGGGHLRNCGNHEDRKAMTMMMTTRPGALRPTRPHRSGQALVLVSLALMTLVALLGISVDGGSLYLHRRGMQNGADAAALAGARVMAAGDNSGADILAEIRKYAAANYVDNPAQNVSA